MALLPCLSFFLNKLLSDMRLCNALDTRYFMIKSWNIENVEIAQRDVSRIRPSIESEAHYSFPPSFLP